MRSYRGRPNFFTLAELARLGGVSRQLANHYLNRGWITPVAFASTVPLFDVSSLRTYVAVCVRLRTVGYHPRAGMAQFEAMCRDQIRKEES